jgi:succinate dehydrogenase hydrophobic anchor subunit
MPNNAMRSSLRKTSVSNDKSQRLTMIITAVTGVVLICYVSSLLIILPFASAQVGTTTNTVPSTTSASTPNSAQ